MLIHIVFVVIKEVFSNENLPEGSDLGVVGGFSELLCTLPIELSGVVDGGGGIGEGVGLLTLLLELLLETLSGPSNKDESNVTPFSCVTR